MKKNERLDALRVLLTVVEKKTPLTPLLQSRPLSPLGKTLCFGVCRHFYRLEALADVLVKKRPKTMDVWVGLLMGLYQLHDLRIPDYAVVQETVALMEAIKKPWAKGLVNAVLRTYCREKETLLTQLQDNPTFKYNHPTWLLNRLKTAWPKDWPAIIAANDLHPPMSLRVNQQRTSVADYLSRLQHVNIDAKPHDHAPEGLVLQMPCDVHDLPGFSEGDVSIQDIAAQMAASLLALKPRLRLLDACAAPGGKTCHILESEPSITAIAIDLDQSRLDRVSDNLKRLNLNATLIKGDALALDTWWDGLLFDRILLDAPCSATGVIRRHPDIKLLRKEEDIDAVIMLQQQLLETLWPLIAPGGLLVYATCSILPEENEMQIARFVAKQTNCTPSTKTQAWGRATGHGWQILPGDHQMDGFFYSVLLKNHDS